MSANGTRRSFAIRFRQIAQRPGIHIVSDKTLRVLAPRFLEQKSYQISQSSILKLGA
jgi:hypothetical protein